MNKSARWRLAETEVIFRDVNQTVADFITEEEGRGTTTAVPFYCECSDRTCRARIRLTPADYQQSHHNRRSFIVLPDHEEPEIEKIVKRETSFYIIEKYGDPPSSEEIDTAIKKLKQL